MKAQSIISAPLIANYILKLKVKKNIWQNVVGVEMPFEMKFFFKSESRKPQQQILPILVRGSADLNHNVADINKGDII